MKIYHTLMQSVKRGFVQNTSQELKIHGNASLRSSIKLSHKICLLFLPVLKPTYGILDWTIQEIRNIDPKTRKLLSMISNFHINSDVNCLFIPRSEGSRGLK